jgi:hypothetical protein
MTTPDPIVSAKKSKIIKWLAKMKEPVSQYLKRPSTGALALSINRKVEMLFARRNSGMSPILLL